MNENEVNNNENIVNQTPGELLRAAREKRGCSQADVAKKMRLSLQVVKDIERDDYSHLAAVIYIRGYLRSYAKIVGFPEAEVLESFEKMDVSVDPERRSCVTHVAAVHICEKPRRFRAITWIMVLLVCAALASIGVWLRQHKRFAMGATDHSNRVSLSSNEHADQVGHFATHEQLPIQKRAVESHR